MHFQQSYQIINPTFNCHKQLTAINIDLQNYQASVIPRHPQIDQSTIKLNFQRALQLLVNNKQTQFKIALSILQHLCQSIKQLYHQLCLSPELMENIFINCWRLKNILFRQSSSPKESLTFIRQCNSFLMSIYTKNKVISQGIHLLYLIQANEQFNQCQYQSALSSCQMSIRHCNFLKNKTHLLKVEYLKSNIFVAINQPKQELQSIKKTLSYISYILVYTNDQSIKQYINTLKKTLSKRYSNLKSIVHINHYKQQKLSCNSLRPHNFDNQLKVSRKKSQKHSTSKQLIRKRSASLKMMGQKGHLMKQKIILNRQKAILTANQSKNMQKRWQMRQEKLRYGDKNMLNVKRQVQKLKKKPLKIEQRNSIFYAKIKQDQINQLNFETLPQNSLHHLFNARPTIKSNQRFNTPISYHNLQNSVKQYHYFIDRKLQAVQPQQKSGWGNSNVQQNKQSIDEELNEKISPITHQILAQARQSNISQQSQIGLWQNRQNLMRQCVQQFEENIFNFFVKKNYLKIDEDTKNQVQNQFNAQSKNFRLKQEIILQSSSRFIDLQSQPIIDNQNISIHNLDHMTSINNHPKIYNSTKEQHWHQINPICYPFGILSDIRLRIGQRGQSMITTIDEQQNFFVYMRGFLNGRLMACKLMLNYQVADYLKGKTAIQDIEYQYIYNQKQNIYNLLSNRLIVARQKNGITLKQKCCFKQMNGFDAYKLKLTRQFIIYQICLQDQQRNTQDKKRQTHQEQINNCDLIKQGSSIEIKYEEGLIFIFLQKLLNQLRQTIQIKIECIQSRRKFKTELIQRLRKNTDIKSLKNNFYIHQALLNSKTHKFRNDVSQSEFDQHNKDQLVTTVSNCYIKISHYLQSNKGLDYALDFYYGMKFLLIKPVHHQKDILRMYYNTSSIEDLIKLKDNTTYRINLTCFKVKHIFKKVVNIFYRIEMNLIGTKIKMIKLILNSSDIANLSIEQRSKRLIQQNQRNSAYIQQFTQMQTTNSNLNYENLSSINHNYMLNLLNAISENVEVKKKYAYSQAVIRIAGITYKNQFKLQGKALKSKQFMIPYVHPINILFQKSIFIRCQNIASFSVFTIRYIQNTSFFHIILYFPSNQKTYILSLEQKIVQQISENNIDAQNYLGGGKIIKILFDSDQKQKAVRYGLWNQFLMMAKFEIRIYESNLHIIFKINSYSAFFKNCSLNSFFQIDKTIYYLEISIVKQQKNSNQSHKSSIFKKFRQEQVAKLKRRSKEDQKKKLDMKDSLRQIVKRKSFNPINQIYESEAQGYKILIALISVDKNDSRNDQKSQNFTKELPQESKEQYIEGAKINFSFWLSELLAILRQSEEDVQSSQQFNQFKEQIFRFANILRAMDLIKFQFISELNQFSNRSDLFKSQETIKYQKIFYNCLSKRLRTYNTRDYSLNRFKKLRKHQHQIFIINKSILDLTNRHIITLFYEQQQRMIVINKSRLEQLSTKQLAIPIIQMVYPWIRLYGREEVLKVSRRLFKYFRNVLMFV